jgi:hypothetical protein
LDKWLGIFGNLLISKFFNWLLGFSGILILIGELWEGFKAAFGKVFL